MQGLLESHWAISVSHQFAVSMKKKSQVLTLSFCLRQRAQANVVRDELKESIPFISDLIQSAPPREDFNQRQERSSTAWLTNH